MLLKLFSNFFSSFRQTQELHDAQMRLNPGKNPINLVADVVTRWNSTLHMLQRIYRLIPAFEEYVAGIQSRFQLSQFANFLMVELRRTSREGHSAHLKDAATSALEAFLAMKPTPLDEKVTQ